MPNVDPQRRRHLKSTPSVSETFALAASTLRAAEHVCILSGHELAAESGVLSAQDGVARARVRSSTMSATAPATFNADPAHVWRMYAERRRSIRGASPNAGHIALATLQSFVSHCTVITEGVDDLHQRAGSSVLPLRGSVMRVRCSRQCGVVVDEWNDASLDLPVCADCGAYMRPDVVWPGEPLHQRALQDAQAATLACDVFVSIAASSLTDPAARLPWIAAQHGATVIAIDEHADRTERSGASIMHLNGRASMILPVLIQRAFLGRRPRARTTNGADGEFEMDSSPGELQS